MARAAVAKIVAKSILVIKKWRDEKVVAKYQSAVSVVERLKGLLY